MKFSKGHFEAIAKILKEHNQRAQHSTPLNHCSKVSFARMDCPACLITDLAYAFANQFTESNDRFDRARFFAACGYPRDTH